MAPVLNYGHDADEVGFKVGAARLYAISIAEPGDDEVAERKLLTVHLRKCGSGRVVRKNLERLAHADADVVVSH